MLIVALGDIHDRFTNLDRVLADIHLQNPDTVICTGDLSTSQMLIHLASAFDGPEIHLVLGNLDDEMDIKATIDREKLLKVYYHGLTGRLTLDKKRVAFAHKPKDAAPLLEEQVFDVVFYGHTHNAKIEQHDNTLFVNPGDIQGRFGGTPSYVTYDTATSVATLHKVD